MRSVPRAVATGFLLAISNQLIVETRSLPLPVLTLLTEQKGRPNFFEQPFRPLP
jgi:hypothetical protein